MAESDEVSGKTGGEATPPDAGSSEDGRPVLPPDPATDPAGTATQPVLKTRWRDRAWSFRAMLAVALASLVIGGVAGGGVVAVAGDDHHGRHGAGPGDEMPPGWRDHRGFGDGGPRWKNGPQPPDSSVTPDGQPSPPTPSPSG